MSATIKKQSYHSAKEIAKDSDYFVDKQGVSLPWRVHFFNYPIKNIDFRVELFCLRDNKEELLILDSQGAIFRYYSDVEYLQKTRLLFNEKVYAMEVMGESLILQFEERIESYALSNGQIIWSKLVSPQTRLRKCSESSIIFYEPSIKQITCLNHGGETLSVEHRESDLMDISGFDETILSVFQVEDSVHIQNHTEEYIIKLPYLDDQPSSCELISDDQLLSSELISEDQLLSCELIARDTFVLLLLNEPIHQNRVLIYKFINNVWKLQDKLLLLSDKLLFIRKDCKGKVWYLDSEGQIAYVMQNRQYIEKKNPLYLKIDSLKHNTRWHRMLIDYEIPDESNIYLKIASSNTSISPDENRYMKIENLNSDIFLPELQGQYLFIKIYLKANQTCQNSPHIRNIKLIYPRSSYLEYLPAYYQEDKESAVTVERFLSIFETVFSTLEKTRETTPSLLDITETSKENLAWLSSWLGLTYDESWDERRWRTLMNEAPKLFDIRGTREGIERVIEIYSDMRPLIQEPMHTHCLVQWKIVKNIDYEKWKKLDKKEYKKVALKTIDNYSFCVFLKPEQYHKEEEVATIRRIVEEWKPAYTKARVVPLEHRILLGSFVFLGVNTKLEKRNAYLGEVQIPFGGLSPARKNDTRILERVRIGNDAILQ